FFNIAINDNLFGVPTLILLKYLYEFYSISLSIFLATGNMLPDLIMRKFEADATSLDRWNYTC
ncbi:hypothetical protein ACJX0J_020599, partial [Zea mays]